MFRHIAKRNAEPAANRQHDSRSEDTQRRTRILRCKLHGGKRNSNVKLSAQSNANLKAPLHYTSKRWHEPRLGRRLYYSTSIALPRISISTTHWRQWRKFKPVKLGMLTITICTTSLLFSNPSFGR